jgi:hypothetical protein
MLLNPEQLQGFRSSVESVWSELAELDARECVKELKRISEKHDGLRVTHCRGLVSIGHMVVEHSWADLDGSPVELYIPIRNPDLISRLPSHIVDGVTLKEIKGQLSTVAMGDFIWPGEDPPKGVMYKGKPVLGECK